MDSVNESTAAPGTAYTSDQAVVYDATRFTAPAGRRIHAFERDILLGALRKAPRDARVLEVGCGTGRLMVEALQAGYHVDGADGSSHMMQELRKKLGDEHRDVQLLVCGAAEIPLPDASYDFVYAIRLLNQTESPAYALSVVREMLRLTKPGGHALVEFVNQHRPRWGVNRRPTTRLTPAQVVDAGREAGGERISYHGAFFLSMQAYRAVPGALVPIVSGVDRALSALLPRLCSRSYVLLRRTEAPR